MNKLKRRNQILILMTCLSLLLSIWLLTSGKYRIISWGGFLFLFSAAGVFLGSAGIWITANKMIRAGLILDNQIIDAGAIISCFGILINGKVIPFNQQGIRLKAIEISNANIFITYGSDKKTGQIEQQYEWKKMEEIRDIAENFATKPGFQRRSRKPRTTQDIPGKSGILLSKNT